MKAVKIYKKNKHNSIFLKSNNKLNILQNYIFNISRTFGYTFIYRNGYSATTTPNEYKILTKLIKCSVSVMMPMSRTKDA